MRRPVLLLTLAFANILLLLLVAHSAQAATITVTTAIDELNTSGNGLCSLREAIAAANQDKPVGGCSTGNGLDTIRLPSNTYLLTMGILKIARPLQLIGEGHTSTLLDGGNVAAVISISDTHATLTGITIQNGKGRDYDGGGIQLSAVTADSYLTLTDSLIFSNTSQIASGGISIMGNRNQGKVANATINRSMIVSNTLISPPGLSGSYGGGIYCSDGALSVSNTWVDKNHLPPTSSGGGLIALNCKVLIDSSTFSQNSADAGGAIHYEGNQLIIFNSTLSGNTSSSSGSVLYGNLRSAIMISNTTVVSNGNISVAAFFIGFAQDGFKIVNTILANPRNCESGQFAITSLGHNISSDTSCELSHASDRINTNPLITPLQLENGLAPTHALLPGSPAIDSGDDSACPKLDQRGIARPIGQHCDVGSYEYFPSTSKVYMPLSAR